MKKENSQPEVIEDLDTSAELAFLLAQEADEESHEHD